MTTIALNSNYWSFFAGQADEADSQTVDTSDQIAQITAAEVNQNPPDLGISVSDESSAGESLG